MAQKKNEDKLIKFLTEKAKQKPKEENNVLPKPNEQIKK